MKRGPKPAAEQHLRYFCRLCNRHYKVSRAHPLFDNDLFVVAHMFSFHGCTRRNKLGAGCQRITGHTGQHRYREVEKVVTRL